MKKLLLATAITLSMTTVASAIPTYQLSAQAVSANDFAKALKKGKLPGSKGHVGMSYKQLKKVAPNAKKWSPGDPFGGVIVGKDNYGYKTNKASARAQIIGRHYQSGNVISKSSLEKKIGKPYKTYYNASYYKKGKYALLVIWPYSNNDDVHFTVGTPETVNYIPL